MMGLNESVLCFPVLIDIYHSRSNPVNGILQVCTYLQMRCGPDRSNNTNPTEDHESRIILIPVCQVPKGCPHKDGGAGIESSSLRSYLIITEVAHHSIQILYRHHRCRLHYPHVLPCGRLHLSDVLICHCLCQDHVSNQTPCLRNFFGMLATTMLI